MSEHVGPLESFSLSELPFHSAAQTSRGQCPGRKQPRKLPKHGCNEIHKSLYEKELYERSMLEHRASVSIEIPPIPILGAGWCNEAQHFYFPPHTQQVACWQQMRSKRDREPFQTTVDCNTREDCSRTSVKSKKRHHRQNQPRRNRGLLTKRIPANRCNPYAMQAYMAPRTGSPPVFSTPPNFVFPSYISRLETPRGSYFQKQRRGRKDIVVLPIIPKGKKRACHEAELLEDDTPRPAKRQRRTRMPKGHSSMKSKDEDKEKTPRKKNPVRKWTMNYITFRHTRPDFEATHHRTPNRGRTSGHAASSPNALVCMLKADNAFKKEKGGHFYFEPPNPNFVGDTSDFRTLRVAVMNIPDMAADEHYTCEILCVLTDFTYKSEGRWPTTVKQSAFVTAVRLNEEEGWLAVSLGKMKQGRNYVEPCRELEKRKVISAKIAKEHIENNPHIGVRFRRFQDREHVNKQLKKLQKKLFGFC